jgi:hypothetical protein
MGQVLSSSDDQTTGGLGTMRIIAVVVGNVVPTLMVQSVQFVSLPIHKSWVPL